MDTFSQFDQQISAWVDAHRGEIVEQTQRLLQIPSVKEDPEPDAPYGIESRRALEFALTLAKLNGLETKIVDGHAGHAEYAAMGVAPDAPIVGVLAHVDVVPAGDGWIHPPFGGEIEGGVIYGRGAIDDKGPAIAGLYAILAVKESGVPLSHRVRLILGANEESGKGFSDLRYYFAREEMPALGFTPDADFPLVYAEKGISEAVATRKVEIGNREVKISSLKGGLRPNMVPDYAEAVIEGASEDALQALSGVETEALEPGKYRIVTRGVSAHGSTPEKGTNAIGLLCGALQTVLTGQPSRDLLATIESWATDTTGAMLDIADSDDVAGPLTSNLGVIEYANGDLTAIFNIRYPVTSSIETLRGRLTPALERSGFALTSLSDTPSLFVPLDDPLVNTLLTIYREETGDQTPPKTIGGGTYARALKHGVAFGPEFPGQDHGAHQADEHWEIDELIRATKIYARAIARLANL